MVDTAIFSIFHRAPTPPAPPPPEPAKAAAPPAAPPVEEIAAPPPALVLPEPAPEPPAPEPVAQEPPVAEIAAPPIVHEAAHPVEPPHELPAEQPAVAMHVPPPEEPIAEIVTEPVAPAALPLEEPEAAPHPEPIQAHEEPLPDPPEAEAEPEHHPAYAEEPAFVPETAPAVVHHAHDEADEEHLPRPPESHHDEMAVAAHPPVTVWDESAPLVEEEAAPIDEGPVPSWDPAPPAPEPAWHGIAEVTATDLEADQLGLANPVVITLTARLADSPAIALDASQSGIYRPPSFRAAPWSGFAYDRAADGRTGMAAGTRILTSRGEIEVEKLLPGDTALTLRSPALLPIAWIGRSVATAPLIWIDASALGPDLPRRALYLAPDQAVYVDPIPVPAAHLVNGTTIQVIAGEDWDLFHVDVGKSEILFAEGVPLSSGDRSRLRQAS